MEMELMAASAEVGRILQELAALERVRTGLPISSEDARRKLRAQALDDAEIAARMAAFTTSEEVDKTVVLANYELLHGVGYLDRASQDDEGLSAAAGAVLAIFRGAEICLRNLAVLSLRMKECIEARELGEASIMARWCHHFHGTLYQLSQLVVEMDRGDQQGDCLSIDDSSAFGNYRRSVTQLHELLRTDAAETEDEIATRDLDDPRRYIGFHEFVNRNYEMIWRSVLGGVRLPGVARRAGESTEQFFSRMVHSDDLRLAVESVDLTRRSYLMQFRAYHQISEVLVKYVDEWGCKAILRLLSTDEAQMPAVADILSTCNKLLRVVNDNIKPIVRTLSPKAYSNIRPALGITSGSHSTNLRRALFNTVYPLLVQSFRLRICAFDDKASSDDQSVYARAVALLGADGDAETADVMRNIVYFHQRVRVWRDEHFQFIKTQIGVSTQDSVPTASISGSENAALTAHKLRSVHRTDPIAPLYRALLGRSPATLDVLQAGEFDDYMARLTASAVKGMYCDVQERVQKRRSNRSTVRD